MVIDFILRSFKLMSFVGSYLTLLEKRELELTSFLLDDQILQMLNDPNHAVREAAILCIEVCRTHGGIVLIALTQLENSILN